MSESKPKEEKIFCHRCGEEISKYAYLHVVIQPTIVIQDEKFSIASEDLYFCLKCYYTYKDVMDLLSGDP